MNYPKISIVTPSFNQGQFLEETIISVIGQQYPNLEYIIMDGGSTDNSVEIIKKYNDKISFWVSESDEGMYDALNKGFVKATGEIMTWINSDDLLAYRSLFTIAEIFQEFPQVSWVTGLGHAFIDEKGRNVGTPRLYKWSRQKYLLGDFKWIQQEGTFWSKSLWEKAGSFIDTKYELAADMELWSRFFEFSNLYTIEAITGLFRVRSNNQKSKNSMNEYLKEANSIIHKMPRNQIDHTFFKKYKLFSKLQRIPILWRLFDTPTILYPPTFVFDSDIQKFTLIEG